MRTCLLAFLGLFLLGSSDKKPVEKKLGPEWTLDQNGWYQRPIQAKAYALSDSIRYSMVTQGKKMVDVSESDDGRSYSVGIEADTDPLVSGPVMRMGRPVFQVKVDERGRIVEYTVTLGDVTYYDFNGDGIIDGIVGRNTTRIVYQDRWVVVRNDRRGGLSHLNRATSDDGKTIYEFENGAWKAK